VPAITIAVPIGCSEGFFGCSLTRTEPGPGFVPFQNYHVSHARIPTVGCRSCRKRRCPQADVSRATNPPSLAHAGSSSVSERRSAAEVESPGHGDITTGHATVELRRQSHRALALVTRIENRMTNRTCLRTNQRTARACFFFEASSASHDAGRVNSVLNFVTQAEHP